MHQWEVHFFLFFYAPTTLNLVLVIDYKYYPLARTHCVHAMKSRFKAYLNLEKVTKIRGSSKTWLRSKLILGS